MSYPEQTQPTKMNNTFGDPPVTRVNHPEHFSSEPDNTKFYIPKGQGEAYSSLHPRVQLPFVEDGSARNHAVVVTTTSAALIDRQRSYANLVRMAAQGNESADTMLTALKDYKIA